MLTIAENQHTDDTGYYALPATRQIHGLGAARYSLVRFGSLPSRLTPVSAGPASAIGRVRSREPARYRAGRVRVDALLANTRRAEVTCLQVAGPMGDLQLPAAFVVTAG